MNFRVFVMDVKQKKAEVAGVRTLDVDQLSQQLAQPENFSKVAACAEKYRSCCSSGQCQS
jgi:hypothetical protein